MSISQKKEAGVLSKIMQSFCHKFQYHTEP